MVRRAYTVSTAIMCGGVWIGMALIGTTPAKAQLDTVNTVPCAQEGGVCRMPHPTNVYYGVPGKTNGRPFPQGGSIACTTQSFGDPAPGQRKSCWYAPKLADSRRGGGGADYRNDDDRSGYRGRDRDYDRPRQRSYDDDYAPRRRSRRDLDDE